MVVDVRRFQFILLTNEGYMIKNYALKNPFIIYGSAKIIWSLNEMFSEEAIIKFF